MGSRGNSWRHQSPILPMISYNHPSRTKKSVEICKPKNPKRALSEKNALLST
jgi:hypothetical protein